MSERLATIKELFKLSSGAELLFYEKVLSKIKTDDLIDFKIFVLANKDKFETFETALVRLAKEFEAGLLLKAIRKGQFKFSDKETMIAFIRANFKGKEIASGVGTYKDLVTISMDTEGYLINRYTLKKLTSSDENDFWDFLFKEQFKIGLIRHISTKEQLMLEAQKQKELDFLRRENELKRIKQDRAKRLEYDKNLDIFLEKLQFKILTRS